MTELKDIDGLRHFGLPKYKNTQQLMFREGNVILNIPNTVTMTEELEKQYLALFGCGLEVCVALYILLLAHGNVSKLQPKHVYWVLAWLKTYENERNLARTLNADRKTLRTWLWDVMHAIEDLGDILVSSNSILRVSNIFSN